MWVLELIELREKGNTKVVAEESCGIQMLEEIDWGTSEADRSSSEGGLTLIGGQQVKVGVKKLRR